MNIQELWATLGVDESVEELPDENKWELIRKFRNELLTRCDWTQLPDAPCASNEELHAAWRTYRQVLRDLPDLYATPDEVIFPTPPE